MLTPDDRASLRHALRLGQAIVRGLFEQRSPETLRGLAYELTDELRALRDRLEPATPGETGGRP